MATKKQQTPVVILNRYFIKRNAHVVYEVLSSDGVTKYLTTLVNGKATGCSCPSYKPCKHMTACEQKEATRTPAQGAEQEPVAVAVVPAQAAVVATGAVSTAQEREKASLSSNRAFSLLRR